MSTRAQRLLRARLTSALRILPTLLCLGLARDAHAEINVWTATNGPEGGSVRSLAIDPNTPSTLYAATNAGVFKSTDAGTSWRASGGLTDTSSIAIDPLVPSTLYAEMGNFLSKSTDGGANWNVLSITAFSLAIDPSLPSTLYATGFDGVFKSTDGGNSWTASGNGLPRNTSPRMLVIDPRTPGTLYAGLTHGNSQPGGVFKSTDGGTSWSSTGLIGYGDPHADVNVLAIDPSTPNTLYAGARGGVAKSTDGGTTWSAASNGLPLSDGTEPVIALAIDPRTPSTLYAVAGALYSQYGGGVFKSTDGGANWSASNIGLLNSDVVTVTIAPLTPATLYAGTFGGGVFKSADGAASWRASNTGLHAISVGVLAIEPTTPGTLYAGSGSSANLDGQGVFKSTDRGATWSSRNSGLPANASIASLGIDPVESGTLYAGTSGALFKSTDGGTSWSASPIAGLGGGRSVDALSIDPLTHSTLYAGTLGEGVLKSTDAGTSWNAVLEQPASEGLVVTAIAIDPQTPATLYAGSPPFEIYGPRIFKSTDGGAGWNAIPIDAGTIFAVLIDPTSPRTLYVGSNFPEVLKSMDAGASWSSASTGLPNTSVLNALAIDPHHPRTLYAGYGRSPDADFGVFRSTDGGASWHAFNTGLINADVRSLAIDPAPPSIVYAGTAAGVFAIQPATFTVDSTDDASDAKPGDGVCATATGVCTLRAAIDEANALPGPDTIVFDLTLPAMITLTNTELLISADVTIRGPTTGALAIDGNSQATRVFAITAGTVSIANLTIQNGAQNGDGSHLGGGILVDSGASVTLTNCTLSGNTADAGGGLYNNGTATLTNCTLSGNHANAEGAGIENRGTVTLTNSTLSLNSGTYGGGGLTNHGTAALIDCTLSDNSGCCGDGIENDGTVTLTNCTLSSNGFDNGGTATLINCTLSGGGLANRGTATLTNTIVANNEGNCSGTIASLGHNLDSDGTCGLSGAADLSNDDPRLGPLQDNGGPTFTQALLPGSPAIDAGDDAVTGAPLNLTTDQRGLPRKAGLHVDIGAYESAPISCAGDCDGRDTVTIDELLTMVNIALGNASVTECEPGDTNHDLHITIDEILAAVHNALNGCATS